MNFASPLTLLSAALLFPPAQRELSAPIDLAPSRASLAAPAPRTPRAAAGERRLALYDVRDFVAGHRPVADPVAVQEDGLDSAARPSKGDLDAKLELARRAEVQAFAEFALGRLTPALSADAYQLQVLGPETFGLVAAGDVHDRLQQFLERQRAYSGFVDVRVRIVEGSRDAFARAGFSVDAHAAPLTCSPEEIERRLALEPSMGIAMAPQLTTRPLQHAELALLDEFKFVMDWTVETVLPGPSEIVVPKIGVVREGHSIGMRAAVLDAEVLALDLEFARSVLRRPIPTTALVLGDANHTRVEIALPSVDTVTLRSACSLPSRGTFAFVTPPSEGQPDLLILVSASLRAETPATGR